MGPSAPNSSLVCIGLSAIRRRHLGKYIPGYVAGARPPAYNKTIFNARACNYSNQLWKVPINGITGHAGNGTSPLRGHREASPV